MSAPAAALPSGLLAIEDQDGASARAENAAWEIDRAAAAARSARRAWLVAGIAVTLALLAVAAVFVQGPLRRIEVIPVVVDRTTGQATLATRLDVDTIPVLDALDQHNAVKFIRCRESYQWMFLQRDYDCVRRMSTPAVFSDYNKQFDGPESLDKRLGALGEHRVEIISIRLPPGGRIGNVGEAIVTFDKEVRVPNKPQPELRRFVSTVRFEYRPKLLETQGDRVENPFGFLATAYRADSELVRDTHSPNAQVE